MALLETGLIIAGAGAACAIAGGICKGIGEIQDKERKEQEESEEKED